jgi:hypothetical protein
MFDDDAIAVSHLAAIKQGWSEPYRQSVLDQYIGYMDQASDGCADNPSLDVDALWHEHMLHSTSYVRFCQARYGRYIHHEPRLDQDTATILALRLGGRLPEFFNVPSGSAAQAETGFANCGQPYGPTNPEPGRAAPPSTSALANCGQPEEPEPPPAGFTVANCGPPQQPPLSPHGPT